MHPKWDNIVSTVRQSSIIHEQILLMRVFGAPPHYSAFRNRIKIYADDLMYSVFPAIRLSKRRENKRDLFGFLIGIYSACG